MWKKHTVNKTKKSGESVLAKRQGDKHKTDFRPLRLIQSWHEGLLLHIYKDKKTLAKVFTMTGDAHRVPYQVAA